MGALECGRKGVEHKIEIGRKVKVIRSRSGWLRVRWPLDRREVGGSLCDALGSWAIAIDTDSNEIQIADCGLIRL